MARKYDIVLTKKQLKILRRGWEKYQKVLDTFYQATFDIERWMEEQTKINGVEFFWGDSEVIGIGNAERTMKLVLRKDLEGGS